MGAAVPKTVLRGGSESGGRGRLGAGQEEERLAPPAHSVFPSRTGAVGRGSAWPGVALPPAAPLSSFHQTVGFGRARQSIGEWADRRPTALVMLSKYFKRKIS